MAEKRTARIRLKRGRYKSVSGEHYGTPKEVWGFRTPAARGSPQGAARAFLTANAEPFALEKKLAGLQVQRVIRSLGGSHVILKQVHAGYRVHRGYVTVHMDRAGRVYLAKNRSVPARLLPKVFHALIGRGKAVRKARHSLPKKDRDARVRESERLWFPYHHRLVPPWKVRITRHKPPEDWIVYGP